MDNSNERAAMVAEAVTRLELAVTARNSAQRNLGIAGAAVDAARESYCIAFDAVGEAEKGLHEAKTAITEIALANVDLGVDLGDEEIPSLDEHLRRHPDVFRLYEHHIPVANSIGGPLASPCNAFCMEDGPAYVGIFGW
jgi:hypothetical protein